MLISYDAYRVFYTVARLGSFTKAAGTLLSSQPNLTRTIRNLESALGCTLFVRSNRGAVLTPEGEKLFARVAVACEQIQAGEEELASDRSLQSGVVSIGASETALHGFLLPVLGAFHRAHPGIRLRIANYSTPQAFSALRNGLVDVAVVTSPTADTSGLHIEPLGQFEEVPVCGPSLMHLCGQKLTLADLSAYPFISLGRETPLHITCSPKTARRSRRISRSPRPTRFSRSCGLTSAWRSCRKPSPRPRCKRAKSGG